MVVVSWGNPMWLKQSTDISTACFYATTIKGPQLYDEELFRPQTADLRSAWNNPISIHNSSGLTMDVLVTCISLCYWMGTFFSNMLHSSHWQKQREAVFGYNTTGRKSDHSLICKLCKSISIL